jgi:hypothetical protein
MAACIVAGLPSVRAGTLRRTSCARPFLLPPSRRLYFRLEFRRMTLRRCRLRHRPSSRCRAPLPGSCKKPAIGAGDGRGLGDGSDRGRVIGAGIDPGSRLGSGLGPDRVVGIDLGAGVTTGIAGDRAGLCRRLPSDTRQCGDEMAARLRQRETARREGVAIEEKSGERKRIGEIARGYRLACHVQERG